MTNRPWLVTLVKPDGKQQTLANYDLEIFLVQVISFMDTHYWWEDSMTIVDYCELRSERKIKNILTDTLRTMFKRHIMYHFNELDIYSKLTADYIIRFETPNQYE